MDKIWYNISQETAKVIQGVHSTHFRAGPICRNIYEASGSSIDSVPETKYHFAIELKKKLNILICFLT